MAARLRRSDCERRDSDSAKTASEADQGAAAPIRHSGTAHPVTDTIVYRRADHPSRRRTVSTCAGEVVFPRREPERSRNRGAVAGGRLSSPQPGSLGKPTPRTNTEPVHPWLDARTSQRTVTKRALRNSRRRVISERALRTTY